MKRSYENRERFTPVPGEVYDNAGGSRYRCESLCADGSAWFTNVKSGWHFNAKGVSPPTGRKRLEQPETLTLGDLDRLSRKGHIPMEELREAIIR